jgi:hypothetical protein
MIPLLAALVFACRLAISLPPGLELNPRRTSKWTPEWIGIPSQLSKTVDMIAKLTVCHRGLLVASHCYSCFASSCSGHRCSQ